MTTLLISLLVLAAPDLAPQPKQLAKPLPHHYAMAHAMMAAPAGAPEQVPAPDEYDGVRAALLEIVIGEELTDERDTKWMFVYKTQDEFQVDLDYLRETRERLRDCPPLSSAGPFPSSRFIWAALDSNRDFQLLLEKRLGWELDRRELILDVMEEAIELQKAWQCLSEARHTAMPVANRRLALKFLREHLGEADFAVGKMPPFLPDWRLTHYQR